jgi:hypothetical protein
MMSHRDSVSIRNRGLGVRRVRRVAHLLRWGLSQGYTRRWNGYLELHKLVWLLGVWVHLRRHWPAVWVRGEELLRWRMEVHRRCRRRRQEGSRHEFDGSKLDGPPAQSICAVLFFALSASCDILLSPLASAFVGSLFEAGLTRELVYFPVTFWTTIAPISEVVTCHTRTR